AASTVVLGDDSDADVFTLTGTSTNLSVTGDTDGIDTLVVDRSDFTDAVTRGRLDDSTDGGILSDVTAGDVSFVNIAQFQLLLGTGNDQFTIDAGTGLDGTNLLIDGGVSDDVIDVVTLSDITAVSGGDDEDTVNLYIARLPTANQFTDLGLTVETLAIQNSDNPTSTRWALVDASLTATNPAVGTPITVIDDILQVDQINFFAGTGTNSLTVGTETINDVVGLVDDDGVIVQRNVIGFSALTGSSTTSFTENGYTFSTTGGFYADSGRLAPGADDTAITLKSAAGSVFDLRRLTILDSRTGSQFLTVTGTSSVTGSTVTETVSYVSNGSAVDVSFGELENVSDISFSLGTTQRLDDVVVSSSLSGTGRVDLNFGSILLEAGNATTLRQPQTTVDFALPLTDAFTYNEDSLTIVGDKELLLDSGSGLGLRGLSDDTTITMSSADGGAMAIYSIELRTTAATAQVVPFTVTLINGEEIKFNITVQPGSDWQTFSSEFLALGGLVRSVQWTADTDVIADKIVAAGRITSTMAFDNVDSSTIIEAGYQLKNNRFFRTSAAGLLPALNSNTTLTSVDGRPFTLESLDFSLSSGSGPVEIAFRATDAQGQTITESATFQAGSGLQTYKFKQLIDVRSVEFSNPFHSLSIDNLVASQGLLADAAASQMPTPLPTPVDIDTLSAQAIIFHTSNLNDNDTSNDSPRITVDGVEVTSLNGTDFSVEFLDATETAVTPVAGQRYITRFTFHGDLVIPDGSQITAIGDHALSIHVENNATIGDGVTFDVSGTPAEVRDVIVDFTDLGSSLTNSYTEQEI
ncbi:MAG: hypothetical protein MI861_22885, partial [Pirellulales bacterium]|nr:hypothetical protein [Pirellulales bacterium]